MVTLSAPFKI